MKRWLIRLSALSAVLALGCVAVVWGQRHWGEEPPGPDFSQAPVNAEAVAASTAGNEADAASSTTAPATDPFQRFSGGFGDQKATEPAPKTDHAPADTKSDRYGSFDRYADTHSPSEPERFQSEADVNTLPPEENHSASNDVGLSAADAARQMAHADSPPPTDPFGLQQPAHTAEPSATTPPATSAASTDATSSMNGADRYPAGAFTNDSSNPPAEPQPENRLDNQVVPTVGLAEPTGTLAAPDPAMERRLDPNAAPPADEPNTNAGFDPRNYRTPATLDHRAANLQPLTPGDQANTPPGADPYARSASASAATVPPSYNSNSIPTYGSQPPVSPTHSATSEMAIPGINPESLSRPGDRQLEGPQTPTVTIEKIAPPEVQVGKPAKFQIIVRNTGMAKAENVEVVDATPKGTQLLTTTPQASVGPRGEIVWKVGDLQPGAESKLEMEVMPQTEGEIGSVAMVQFCSAASMRTISTKPDLVLEINAPKQVMIGGDVTLAIKLSNPGTGAASKVVLQERVPQGFQHPAGGELEFEVGQLMPGETRELSLSLHAVQAGKFVNAIVAHADANLRVEQSADIEVVAPLLKVGVDGPGLRYLDRQAKYTVSVGNPGTAPARDVELVAHLPKGMQFVEASDSGHYDGATHSVIWSLAELPPGQSGSVMLTALAAEQGEQKLRTEGRAAGGLTDAVEEVTMVEGVAAVGFSIVDVDDPVEVGGSATYEIRVVNQGSKAAGKVQVWAELPPQLKPTSAEGPSRHSIEGQRVVFEPLSRLAPKADVTYKVVAQGVAPGDLRIKAHLMTEDMAQPVMKEESTKVYKD